MTTVLPASGASAATCGGRSSSSTSRFDAELAQPRELGARASRLRCSVQAGGDLRPDVLDLLERLLVGVGDLLERCE